MSAATANLPAAQKASKPPLVTGGRVAPIIPHTVEEMFRVAAAISGSGLAPKTLDTPEKVLVAVMAGAELGLAPHQAVQSFYVVNNRPTLWGDAIPALLWANGFKLKEWFEGEGDALVAKCEVTRPTGEVIPGEFSMEDAKLAKLLGKDGPWQTARKRMLKMRARAFACRDGAADVLRGFQVREEVEDYQTVRDVTPRGGTGMRARLEARAPAVEPNGGFDPDFVESELSGVEGSQDVEHDHDGVVTESQPAATGEVEELTDADFEEGFASTATQHVDDDILTWAAHVNRSLENYATEADLNAFTDADESRANFERLEAEHPAAAKSLLAAIRGRRKALASKEQA